MINYYKEFNLDPKMTDEELCDALFQLKKKWIHRQNASDLTKRQKAENMIALIEEAALIFADKLKRDQYDSKLSKENNKEEVLQHAAVEQEENSKPIESNSKNIEKIMNMVTALFNDVKYNSVIELCEKTIQEGITNDSLYLYLGLSYWYSDMLQQAVVSFEKGIKEYPTASILYGNLGALYLYSLNDYTLARSYIDKALELNSYYTWYLSLDVAHLFYTGHVDEAEEKIQNYLEKNPEDQEYKYRISEVYMDYSDKFLTEAQNGGSYISTSQVYDSILYYRNKAKSILPNERTQKAVSVIEEKGKRIFNTENIKGIAGLVFLGCLFAYPLLPVWIILAGVLTYYSYKPIWLLEKMTLTNQRDIANSISRGFTIASYWTLKGIQIAFRILFELFRIFV